jgi:hypothetical protein
MTDVVKKRILETVATRWNLKSDIVNCISEHWINLTECFEKIKETFVDKTTISLASGFMRLMNENDFLF